METLKQLLLAINVSEAKISTIVEIFQQNDIDSFELLQDTMKDSQDEVKKILSVGLFTLVTKALASTAPAMETVVTPKAVEFPQCPASLAATISASGTKIRMFHNTTPSIVQQVNQAIGLLPKELQSKLQLTNEMNEHFGGIGKRDGIRIAIMGMMKSGKSTLWNYILGEKLCLTHSKKCTARRVVYKYGSTKSYQIDNGDLHVISDINDSELQKEISLSDKLRNDANEVKKIVTIYWPNEFLKAGVEVIDVPGLDENKFMDSMIEETIQNVDLIIYAFTLATDFRDKDFTIIQSILDNNSQSNILFVGTKLDTFDRDVSGPRDNADVQCDLNKFLTYIYSFYPKVGQSFSESKYFHAISLINEKKYDEPRNHFVRSISAILSHEIEPLMNKGIDVLQATFSNCINLYKKGLKNEKRALVQLESKYQQVISQLEQKSYNFIKTDMIAAIKSLQAPNRPRVFVENSTSSDAKDLIKDIIAESAHYDKMKASELRPALQKVLYDHFAANLHQLLQHPLESLEEQQTKVKQVCFQDAQFDVDSVIKLFDDIKNQFNVMHYPFAKLFTTTFLDKLKSSILLSWLFDFMATNKLAVAEEYWKKFDALQLVSHFEKSTKDYYKSLRDYFKVEIQKKHSMIETKEKSQYNIIAVHEETLHSLMLAWIDFKQLLDSLEQRKISESSRIGIGAFGCVYKGTYGDKPVAVKRIDISKRLDLISYVLWEIFIMAYVCLPL